MHRKRLHRFGSNGNVALEHPSHRDEYFVRRLEAFGDIVIGFSLALLALSLIVPNHAQMLVEDKAWLWAYVWTFGLVCSMWGAHYWTFRYVFVPTPLTVALNYVKLALIVLLIFTVQVLLRSFELGSARDIVVANELYWGCLIAYWIVAGSLMALGLQARRGALAPEVTRVAVNRICRTAVGVPIVTAAVIVTSHGPPYEMALIVAMWMIVAVVIGALVGRLVTRRRSVRQNT